MRNEGLVRVPATSANLGPGFDAMGMALDLELKVIVSREDIDSIKGALCMDLPNPGENLLFRAADAVFQEAGIERPPIGFAIQAAIPLSCGLGSSAAAIVAGLLAGNSMMSKPLGRLELLQLATKLEGHPDNVVPALVGGVTIALRRSDGTVGMASVPMAPTLGARLGLVAIVPSVRLETERARAALPKVVSHADASFNEARTALLVAILASGDVALLPDALEDRLHQPYRQELIPGMAQIMALGRRKGAWGVTISGAGPTLLAWCPRDRRDEIGATMAACWSVGAQACSLEISESGATFTRDGF